jgi:DNA-binding transcriptional LysR family regulator
LSIAVTSTARYFAPRLLGAFAQLHPGLRTFLHIDNSGAVMERLRRNEDDLYLVADPERGSDIVVQAIVPNPLVAVARADHPLAAESNIGFARFAREPFLMREAGSGTRSASLKVFAQHGITPMTRMELRGAMMPSARLVHVGGVDSFARTLGIEAEPSGLCAWTSRFPGESLGVRISAR